VIGRYTASNATDIVYSDDPFVMVKYKTALHAGVVGNSTN
jgi:hypothetical protein